MTIQFFTDEEIENHLEFQYCLNCGWKGKISECIPYYIEPDNPDLDHLIIFECPKCRAGTV